MIELLLWWLVLAALTLWLASRRGSESPLLLAYFFSLSMIHVPGALNYTGQSVRLFYEQETYTGFRLTLVGLTAMLAVVLVLRLLKLAQTGTAESKTAVLPMGTVYRVILLGALTYFVLAPIAPILPSGGALASTLAGLLPLGFWLWVNNAAKSAQPWPQLLRITLAAALLPVATVLVSGFMGFGVAMALSIAVMVLVVWPQKLPLILAMPIAAYLGLSLGASYFIQRGEIRAAVWGGQSYENRIEASLGIFTNFRFYDINDPDTVLAVEARLNQNVLVGIGVQAHANGYSQLQYGATVPLWSLVPRVLWPDKPQVGGGRNVVSDFTGITFAEGTSVGVGNPLEFYINFGWAGVVGGFVLLGALLTWYDRGLFTGLQRNDLRSVVWYGLPGLTLINPGGNLMEILVAYVAAHVVAYGFVMVLGSAFVARILGFNGTVLDVSRASPFGAQLIRQGR